MMHSRERVRRAVRFEMPDRPPILHGFAGGVILRDADWVRSIYERYPEDFGIEPGGLLPVRNPDQYRKGSRWTNGWGVTKEVGIDYVQAITVGSPLSDWDAFGVYRPPEITAQPYEDLQARIVASGHTKYVMMNVPSLFETMHDLRGMENLCCDFGEDVGRVRALADLVFDIIMQCADHLCATDVDCIGIGDDWGAQKGLFISPRLWREFFKPYYAELARNIHAHDKDMWFHCCGAIMPIVPDFIEIGVDMLHAQIEIFPEEEFLALAKGAICIVSDINRQTIMPLALPDEVYAHTIRLFEKLYLPEGGLVLRAEIGTDVPRENTEAFYRACAEFQAKVNCWEEQ